MSQIRFLNTPGIALLLASITLMACSPEPRNDGWVDLLEDPSSQWRGYQMESLPAGWQFDSTTRVLVRAESGGDIITRDQYSDFELELEWRVGPRGNSGVFYRATEETRRIYENAPEYQILDNTEHPDGQNSSTSAGANYALHSPSSEAARPVGEWNDTRIVVAGSRVEHWLNGANIVEYDLGSDEWKELVEASKFREWPTYGLASQGHIGLQDHGDVVEFRNIRIRAIER